ncbi:MAG TPA: helix-turn-helix domain-containing protein [Holophaga sp.]|nr:helix-turn-helix domain-containing protein [Holophaga sp.]
MGDTHPRSRIWSPGAAREDPTRERLLRAAVRLFSRKGYDDTGIREIGLEAGCNSAMIGFHFGGKHQLYRAAALRACGHVRRVAEGYGPLPIPGAPDAAFRASSALRAAERALLEGVIDPQDPAGPGFEQALVRLFLAELASPRPEQHLPAQGALEPHLAYVEEALRLLHPGLDGLEMRRLLYAQVCRTLILLTYPHLGAALERRLWAGGGAEARQD